MASDVTPETIRRAQFRTAFRGLDRAEVEALLDAVAARLERLETERGRLVAQLQELPSKDLETEFDTVGREVSAILQSAREAAESMRERATLDAAKWRSEAMTEAETARKQAAADAEALRRDAWVTGTEILQQASATAESMRASAERDVLTVMGEAEREAHRLTSGARREFEDMLRAATMEAEKMAADAVSRRDEIIDSANRQAAGAQERTRALEQRRDELLEELENVRSTLSRLETSLEERREALDLVSSQPTSVKVVHPPADAKRHWELGETVRVVPAGGRDEPDPDEKMADELTEEVARLQQSAVETEAEPEPQPLQTTPVEETEIDEEATKTLDSPVRARTQPESASQPSDDLNALFASLRVSTVPPEEGEDDEESASAIDHPADTFDDGIDWIEVREERLLPITNRALRGVRRSIAELQNVALDSLRTGDEWAPEPDQIAELVHADLVAVWSESFAAGHAAAEQMTASKLRRPTTPHSEADKEFATHLAESVIAAIEQAGEGTRERQSASSRVFRVWRSDEAERRIRDIALSGYEAGIERSTKVTADS